jgi:sphingosine kinase
MFWADSAECASFSPVPIAANNGVGTTNTRSIPYFNVLWAEIVKDDLTIRYAKPTSRSSKAPVRVAYINYTLDNSSISQERASRWVDRLLDRAYGQSQRNKRIKLLINPFGGQGKAAKLYARDIEPIFAAARCEVDVERTTHSGHAVEIAQNLDIDAYDVLASASGDGLPHECLNGLAKKSNAAEALRKVAIVQLPCGSGNAMSWNFNGTGECSTAALCIVKGLRASFDIASVTQGEKRTLSFLSQAIGVVAESDLGTDHMRWMGDARFTYGFIVRIFGKTLYPCDIAIKTEIEDKEEIKRHYARYRANVQLTSSNPRPELDGTFDAPTTLGLPQLQYGTILDPLNEDDGWSPLTYVPNLGNLYCGNMAIMAADAPFFPAALPSDGLLDLVTIDGDLGRMKAIDILLSVSNGTFFDKDCVSIKKVKALRVIPKFGSLAQQEQNRNRQGRLGKFIDRTGTSGNGRNASRDEGYFSVDGEKMPFEPFQVEVHPGLATVLCRHPGLYEAPGPQGWNHIDVDAERPRSDTR